MEFEDLRAMCGEASRVVLVVRKRTPPRGKRVRLAGPRSPLGRYVSYLRADEYVAEFTSSDVLAWLDRLEGTEGR